MPGDRDDRDERDNRNRRQRQNRRRSEERQQRQDRSRSRSPLQDRSRSSSSSDSDDEIRQEIVHLKNDNRKIQDHLGKMQQQLDKVSKRVQDNEAHSRQRNIRIYGFNKDLIDSRGRDGLADAIKHFFKDGLKVDADRAKDIFEHLDTYHWTSDNAVIIAFCRRNDKGLLLSKRKNLKGYEPYNKTISMGDDLTPEQQIVRRECQAKFKTMKSMPEKFSAVKMYSYNKIVANDTVKLYNEWDLNQ